MACVPIGQVRFEYIAKALATKPMGFDLTVPSGAQVGTGEGKARHFDRKFSRR